MNQNTRHLFIINPKSFWNKTKQNYVVARIHLFFRKIDNSDYDIYVSRFPRDAVGFIPVYARGLSEETTLRVYAVGGDGILFDCLNGIMGLKNVELAAVPHGYTNNFIRGFGKNDKTMLQIISRQYNAPTIPMDVMRCGDNYTLNYCVVGLEAEIIRRAEEIRKRLEKGNPLYRWLCRHLYIFSYIVSTFAVSSKIKQLHQQYEVNIDEEISHGNYQGFSFFNAPYYGGNLRPINNAMPNDGILDMLGIRCQGILQTYLLFPFYVSGLCRMFPRNFVPKQGVKVSIRSEDIFLFSMDGITFFESELEIELLPSAIRFVDASKHGYKGGSSD